jgi:hypothetical protein
LQEISFNSHQGMTVHKRPDVVVAALMIAVLVMLAYNHFILLLVNSNTHVVRVTALQPAANRHHAAVLQGQQDAAGHQPFGVAQPVLQAQEGFTAAILEGVPEVWASGSTLGPTQQHMLQLVDAGTLAQLKALCGRCLYRTLTSYVRAHNFGDITVVLTGDIPAMWIRDSAVQMASYFPRISRRPAIRHMLEGAIRAQSYFILQVIHVMVKCIQFVGILANSCCLLVMYVALQLLNRLQGQASLMR